MKSEPAPGVAAVERALGILAAFSADAPVLGLGDLANATGLYKSTILRLLGSLERCGYVRRLPDGRYSVGAEPLRLARIYQGSFRLSDVVLPALHRLVAKSEETASLFIRDHDERVCLHRVEPTRIVRVSAQEGDRLPLKDGASGKVILAFGGASGRAMEEIRQNYCAVSVGERDSETAAVASPVFGAENALIGALNVSGPRVRLTERKQRELKTLLLAEAGAMSTALGADLHRFDHPHPAAPARRA